MKKTAILLSLFGIASLVSLGLVGEAADTPEQLQRPSFSFFSYLTQKDQRPAMICFSPAHHDPRPPPFHKIPPKKSLRADLEALRPAFDGLILYGCDPGITPVVLDEAKRLGYRAVLLGIWDINSETELKNTVDLIHKHYNDLALAVCMGNEGITFNRYTLQELFGAKKRLIELLGDKYRVPITTSEPLGEWGQKGLREFGDFLAPNIHPVFDQPELSPHQAAHWVRERARALALVANRPVLVKETGFPHGGDARFTPETQRAFWSSYLSKPALSQPAEGVWVSYAPAFEAADLFWKGQESGMPIEEAWGLMSKDRCPYPAFFLWSGKGVHK